MDDPFIRRYTDGKIHMRFIVKIAPTTEYSHVLDLTDLTQYSSGKSLKDEDHSLRTFLELAVNQLPVEK